MPFVTPTFSIDELKSSARLSETIHRIGHDIGNPLTSIISLSSLLERCADLPSEGLPQRIASYGSSIAREAWRVAALNERMVLLLSERTSFTEPFTVSDLLTQSLRQAEKRLKQAIDINLVGDFSLELSGERDHIIWAFAALIENAVVHRSRTKDSTSAVGETDLTAEIVHDGATASIRIVNTTSQLPADPAQLFEPFHTEWNDKEIPDELSHYRPLGLGLPTAYSIFDRNGAQLSIKIEPQSDRFKFTQRVEFPISAHSERPTTRTNSDIAAPRISRKPSKDTPLQVALLEDEEMVASALLKILKLAPQMRSGLPKIEANLFNPETLNKALQEGQRFHTILCDMNLGVESGEEVLSSLRKERPNAFERIVFLTGDRLTLEKKLTLERDGFFLLEKPFEANELLDLLSRLIDGSDL